MNAQVRLLTEADLAGNDILMEELTRRVAMDGETSEDVLKDISLRIATGTKQSEGSTTLINQAAEIEPGADDLGLLFGEHGVVDSTEIDAAKRQTYNLKELGEQDEHGVFQMYQPIGLVEVLEWQRAQDEKTEGSLTRYYSRNVRAANPFVFFGKQEFGWVTATLVPCKLIGLDGKEWNGHILNGTVTDDRRTGGDVVYMKMPISQLCSRFFTEFSNEVNRLRGTPDEMTKGRVLGIAKRMFDQTNGRSSGGVGGSSGSLKGRGAVAAQRRMMAVPQDGNKDPASGLPGNGNS